MTDSSTTAACYVLSDASICVDILSILFVCLNNSNNSQQSHEGRIQSQQCVSSLQHMLQLCILHKDILHTCTHARTHALTYKMYLCNTQAMEWMAGLIVFIFHVDYCSKLHYLVLFLFLLSHFLRISIVIGR